MATSLISTEAKSVPIGWEIFCAELACGTPATQAALSAGYVEGYASVLVTKPEIQSRVQALVAERLSDGGIVPRAWAELQIIRIIRDAVDGVKGELGPDGKVVGSIAPDRQLARAALMDLARLRGWIVQKKEVDERRATIDLGKLGASDLRGALDAMTARLSPGARRRVESLAAGTTIDPAPDASPADELEPPAPRRGRRPQRQAVTRPPSP